MLNIQPPDYIYCPYCSTKLTSSEEEEGKNTKYCPKCNWRHYPHVGSSCAVIIKKGHKVLMVKRRREPYKNTWMFPAGFTDYGEHPQETAVRETKEETGLQVIKIKLFDVLQSTDDPRLPGHFIFFYLVDAKGTISNKDKKENSDIKWFDLGSLPEIGWQQHKQIIKKLH